MRLTPVILSLGLLLGAPGATVSQEATEPAEPSDEAVVQGRLLYGIYCANCHGSDGRGDGPSVQHLKSRPADLTRLSRDNDGEFPTARVMLVIDGRKPLPGHTRGQMPIWGLTFQEQGADTNQELTVRRKIERLVAFLETLQPPQRSD